MLGNKDILVTMRKQHSPSTEWDFGPLLPFCQDLPSVLGLDRPVCLGQRSLVGVVGTLGWISISLYTEWSL